MAIEPSSPDGLRPEDMVPSDLEARKRKSVFVRLFRGSGGVAVVILGLIVLSGIFAPFLAPFEPEFGNLRESLLPPGSPAKDSSIPYFLGTDRFGRDVLSRVIYGSRVSLAVAAMAVAVAGTLGTTIGIVAGYYGGVVDSILMRLADLVLAMPIILLALVLAVLVGPSFFNVVLILGLVLWAEYARQARAETLGIREREYVLLAEVAGISSIGIMARHILPNILDTILVLATLQVARVIIIEAALSFLGVGIPPPAPAWGLMVSEGRGLLNTSWWISVFPGIAITITILTVNLIADRLKDILDPHGKVIG